MRTFWKQLARELEEGPVCLVSILTSAGSTPRGAGAMMAVFSNGGAAGTIGGGNVELAALLEAKEAIRLRRDALRRYRFQQGEELGMVCGGDVTVQFQFIPAGDALFLQAVEALLAADRQAADAWLARRMEDGCVVETRALTKREGHDLSALTADRPVLTAGESRWFCVPVVQAGQVHIFGGGHISQALVSALHPLEFRCVVYDDRAEFADPARFPLAERTVLCDFLRLDAAIAPADYVVVMTRGHEADYEILSQTLRAGARYIGCIGSRKKLELCRRRLMDAGFTAEEYAALHAPIGLAIGAQTPEEIAVSVAAELIAVRAGA